MMVTSTYWFLIILIFNAVMLLQSTRPWGDRPLLPSCLIPETALDPRHAVVRRKIVLYHNFFRTKVRPSASNMLLMSWHTGAARQAQKYAEQCKYLVHINSTENMVPDLGACGENLFVSSEKTPCMVATSTYWFLIILVFNAVMLLQSTRPWGDRPLFPSRLIPETALDPRRAVVRRKIVLYHNFFRSKVRPSASNMLLMSWHTEAARKAQKYSEQCKFLLHNSLEENVVPALGACGQNLFVASEKTPWFFALKSWFLEYRNFTYGAPVHNLKAVGHYTQMVWATSYKVGCGMARCAGGPWGHYYNYVCHYCPGGNYDTITQYPYKVGVPCGDCPDHCVSESLCNNPCPKKDVFSNCGELVKSDDVCHRSINNCNATCYCGSKRIHKNFPWT